MMSVGERPIKKLYTNPLISHFSFSNPLWMDWAMDDSMRSTYRTTCGANVSRRCWWKRPFFKLSVKRNGGWANQGTQNTPLTLHEARSQNGPSVFWVSEFGRYYRPCGGSRWGSERAGTSPMYRGAVRPGRRPCPRRRKTKISRRVRRASRWTRRMPAIRDRVISNPPIHKEMSILFDDD